MPRPEQADFENGWIRGAKSGSLAAGISRTPTSSYAPEAKPPA